MTSNPAADPRRAPPLRPYQIEPIKAILSSVRARAGLTFVLEISRQGGKNETSARLEAILLAANSRAGGSIVKTAPTLDPQLRTSYDRLTDYLQRDRIPARHAWPKIHVGYASIDFRSAEKSASVVGATASLLLEVDEAQDVDADIYDIRFRPMASTTAATTVLYGTAWSETDLLQRTIEENARGERADGIRRNFIYPWHIVAEHNATYGRFAREERTRLGREHINFSTQYELKPIPGKGRLFNAQQIAQLQGTHPRGRAPVLNSDYIASLDIAGEDTGNERLNDRTVLTIARLVRADTAQQLAGVTPAQIVDQLSWRGTPHSELVPAITSALRSRNVRALTVDATGIGETSASLIAAAVPRCSVEPFKFTQASKSAIGFELLTAVNTGALQLYTADGSDEHAITTRECIAARMETRPNNTINFFVHETEGNDDFLIGLALIAHTANTHPIRQAKGR